MLDANFKNKNILEMRIMELVFICTRNPLIADIELELFNKGYHSKSSRMQVINELSEALHFQPATEAVIKDVISDFLMVDMDRIVADIDFETMLILVSIEESR